MPQRTTCSYLIEGRKDMAEEQMTIPEGGLNVQDAAAMLLQRVESAGENQNAEKEPELSLIHI